jgi:hypothetical protein
VEPQRQGQRAVGGVFEGGERDNDGAQVFHLAKHCRILLLHHGAAPSLLASSLHSSLPASLPACLPACLSASLPPCLLATTIHRTIKAPHSGCAPHLSIHAVHNLCPPHAPNQPSMLAPTLHFFLSPSLSLPNPPPLLSFPPSLFSSPNPTPLPLRSRPHTLLHPSSSGFSNPPQAPPSPSTSSSSSVASRPSSPPCTTQPS